MLVGLLCGLIDLFIVWRLVCWFVGWLIGWVATGLDYLLYYRSVYISFPRTQTPLSSCARPPPPFISSSPFYINFTSARLPGNISRANLRWHPCAARCGCGCTSYTPTDRPWRRGHSTPCCTTTPMLPLQGRVGAPNSGVLCQPIIPALFRAPALSGVRLLYREGDPAKRFRWHYGEQ